jgi:putative FmdB family regulatory protein
MEVVMPTYDYRCNKCGEHLEVFQSFSEPPLTKHSACGGKLVKVLSPAGIVLKGSGFYKTDNKESSRSKSKARSAAGSGDGESSKSESSSSEASESKASESGSSTKGSESGSSAKSA